MSKPLIGLEPVNLIQIYMYAIRFPYNPSTTDTY